MSRPTLNGIAALLAATTAAVALGACGSSSSSSSSDKPSYCDQRDALKGDVQGLTDVKLSAGGVAAVTTQLDKIRSDARDVINKAKGDFPTETADMQRSLDNLRTTVQNTSSSPTVSDLAALGSGVAQVAGSVSAFVDTAGGKC
jgi:hypothetical protein